MRAVIVGQAPARSSRPLGRPLEGRCGDRLARLAGLSGYEELAGLFTLGNLLGRWPGAAGKGDVFPRAEARCAAGRSAGVLGEHDRVLLLGRNVAAAFGLAGRPFLEWFEAGPPGPELAAVFPHPSGVSHFWNEEGNRASAGAFLRELAGLLGR